VVSPVERAAIVKKHPNNIIQLELPEGEGAAKYEHASTLLRQWKTHGVMQRDRMPSFYVIETTFKINDPFAPKAAMKRYGVLSALRLETPGKGAVRPHEKTLPKAKEDRLNLLKAVHTNVSPIFGLFFDKKNEWKKWLATVIKAKPLAVGREKKDLTHRLWKVDDPSLQKKLVTLLKGKELFIADGHHRYEVAWAYKESQLAGRTSGMQEAWNYVMTYICPMEEKGLLMLPTHRLVKSNMSEEQWAQHLRTFFDLKPVKGVADIIKALSASKRETRALGWLTHKSAYLLTLKKDISIDRCLTNRPEALRELDVVLLHDLALGDGKEIIYSRDLNEIKSRVQSDPSWTCFFLASPGVASLARVSTAGEVMPPKTTYFYPKVPTGFTTMPLDQNLP
jgi:uncharacterized protein (DUF1015 family)